MTLSKYERETIIIYNQAEPNAMVYTHDPKLIAKLRRLHDATPEKVYTDDIYSEKTGKRFSTDLLLEDDGVRSSYRFDFGKEGTK